jgi:hypothetical protein
MLDYGTCKMCVQKHHGILFPPDIGGWPAESISCRFYCPDELKPDKLQDWTSAPPVHCPYALEHIIKEAGNA